MVSRLSKKESICLYIVHDGFYKVRKIARELSTSSQDRPWKYNNSPLWTLIVRNYSTKFAFIMLQNVRAHRTASGGHPSAAASKRLGRPLQPVQPGDAVEPRIRQPWKFQGTAFLTGWFTMNFTFVSIWLN